MEIFRSKKALTERLAGVRGVGFVPTMGALHAGHISLVELCREQCAASVVSVFVNPTQFNDPNDLRNYPRDERGDLDMLEKAGADFVFLPSVEEIYPEPDTRTFDFGELDKVMEGASRPGHFNGVAQVVSRLFDIVRPGKAFFGQKDFQQAAIVRALVEQTGQNVQIVECPIVREPDGLAMSSRNALLDPAHRAAAPGIHAALEWGARNRAATPAASEEIIAGRINKDPLLDVIYMNIVDPRTLRRIERWTEGVPARGCVAVRAGSVRLIDNIEF